MNVYLIPIIVIFVDTNIKYAITLIKKRNKDIIFFKIYFNYFLRIFCVWNKIEIIKTYYYIKKYFCIQEN